jgi:hypothetical protein
VEPDVAGDVVGAGGTAVSGETVSRPSKYRPEFARQAKSLTALGATDRELANFFGVAESTLNLWKLNHRRFSESLKLGKDVADKRVEQSLYHRAMGYSHEAVKILMTKDGDVYREEYVEHYPPDTTAAIFWLKNRKPAEWRDKQDIEHSGSVIVQSTPVDEKL